MIVNCLIKKFDMNKVFEALTDYTLEHSITNGEITKLEDPHYVVMSTDTLNIVKEQGNIDMFTKDKIEMHMPKGVWYTIWGVKIALNDSLALGEIEVV